MKKFIPYAVVAATALLGLVFTVKWDKSDQNEEVPVYIKYADSITNPFVKDMCKKHHLSYFGGGGGFLHNVENITIEFVSHSIADVEQARSLLLSCSEELLKRVNADETIRPYLNHYPFTAKDISIGICYFDRNGTWVKSKCIASASVAEGPIYYTIFDEEANNLKTFHKESYQEALKIVQLKDSITYANAPTGAQTSPPLEKYITEVNHEIPKK